MTADKKGRRSAAAERDELRAQIERLHLDIQALTDASDRERRLRRELIDLIPHAVQILDARGHHVYANPAFLRIFPGRVPPPEWSAFTDPQLTRLGLADRLREISPGRPLLFEEEYSFTPADSAAVERDRYSAQSTWLRTAVLALCDAHGDVEQFLIMHEDVTARREDREEVRRGQERLRAQFQHFPIPTFTFRRQDETFVFTDFNLAADTFTYHAIGDIIGRTVDDFFRDRPRIRECMEQCWREKRVLPDEMEYEFLTVPERVLLAVTYVYVGADQIMVHTEDITEKRRAERSLRDSEERYRLIFDNAPIGLVQLDMDGTILDCNFKFQTDIIGAPKRDILGVDVLRSMRNTEMIAAVRAAIDGGTGYYHGAYQSVVGGNQTFIRALYNQLKNSEGLPVGVFGIIDDLTETARFRDVLIDTEERYRRVFESAGDALFLAADGVVFDCNQTAIRMFAAGDKKDVIGRAPGEFCPPWQPDGSDSVAQADRIFRAAALSESPVSVSWVCRRFDGREFHSRVTISRFYSAGKPAFQISVRDVTDRYLAEQARRQAENELDRERRFLRAIIDNNPYSIAVFDRTGRCLEVNDAFLRLFGAKPSREYSILADPFASVPEFVAALDAVKRGERFITAEPVFYESAATAPSAAPLSRWLRMTVFGLNQQSGALESIVVMHEDVTERILAERERLSVETRFRAMIEESHDLFVLVDAQGRAVYQSRPTEGFIGWSFDELFSVVGLAFVHPDDLARVTAALAEYPLRPGLSSLIEFRLRHKNGEWRRIACIVRNLLDNPDVNGIALNVRDVTRQWHDRQERDRMQRQLTQMQRLDALGTFAGGIAHDFKTFLSVIQGFAEIAEEHAADAELVRGNQKQILAATERARQLVEQILLFSRQGEDAAGCVAIHPIVVESLRMLASYLPTRIKVEHQLDPDAGHVSVDATGIQQILMNLYTNAYDAMAAAGGTIRIELAAERLTRPFEFDELAGLAEGTYCRLSVSDTGVGMDGATLARLFEPFFTTKPVGKGNGMGLPVVMGIVQNHRGAIRVESAPGRGTVFHVYLPQVPAPEAEPPRTPAD